MTTMITTKMIFNNMYVCTQNIYIYIRIVTVNPKKLVLPKALSKHYKQI